MMKYDKPPVYVILSFLIRIIITYLLHSLFINLTITYWGNNFVSGTVVGTLDTKTE